MAAENNYIWDEGEDHYIDIEYDMEGVVLSHATHAVRMDLAVMGAGGVLGDVVWSLNSEDFVSELDQPGEDDNEISFPTDTSIRIKFPRRATIRNEKDVNFRKPMVYQYDIFIRDKVADVQQKILFGTITVKNSVTKWA